MEKKYFGFENKPGIQIGSHRQDNLKKCWSSDGTTSLVLLLPWKSLPTSHARNITPESNPEVSDSSSPVTPVSSFLPIRRVRNAAIAHMRKPDDLKSGHDQFAVWGRSSSVMEPI